MAKTLLISAVWASLLATSNVIGVDLIWVIAGSTVCGAFGGIAAALRNENVSAFDLANHAINMGCLGAAVSMLGLWYLEPSISTHLLLLGVSMVCGLVGLPIFDTLSKLVIENGRAAIERFLGGKQDNDS